MVSVKTYIPVHDRIYFQFSIDDARLAVFVTSTTGDGEPPDNAQKFYRRIRKKTLPENHLQNLRFTLLGMH